MWIGGFVMFLGTLAAVWPHSTERRRSEMREQAPAGAQAA
jgi:hypothetical protein